ncbi:hypothetical protein ACFWMP_25390 [Paenibacillus sp. NPDC058367]|uniref:hypothetical protein n=1 Tax=Paenibacillus sp. NPDC058367 TaxID=3346460 RepID=UPI00366077C7
MTQVKDMTDQQLNRALAELMGWTVEIGPVTRLWRLMKDGKIKATSGESEELMWSYAPDYSNDSAASLEVQATATRVDAGGYIQNLLIVMFGELVYEREFSNRLLDFMTAAKINNASPRERAEAAYITLQGARE